MATFVYLTHCDILETAYRQSLDDRTWQRDPDEPMLDWHCLTTSRGFDDIIKVPP